MNWWIKMKGRYTGTHYPVPSEVKLSRELGMDMIFYSLACTKAMNRITGSIISDIKSNSSEKRYASEQVAGPSHQEFLMWLNVLRQVVSTTNGHGVYLIPTSSGECTLTGIIVAMLLFLSQIF